MAGAFHSMFLIAPVLGALGAADGPPQIHETPTSLILGVWSATLPLLLSNERVAGYSTALR